jgi:NAD(P)-dependent dehydrogenase (short-subunit alcohol dehydrogenase family)
MKSLQGKIAVVAGATRGAGRGIAAMLGEQGATVYCTGRSSRTHPRTTPPSSAKFSIEGRPETIEETAEMVTSYGGVGIPVRVDHTDPAQVAALFERVRAEQGRLDILVNDIWGGDALIQWNQPFWEMDVTRIHPLMERAIYTHIITSRYGAPLLIEGRQGLIVEIGDGDTLNYRGNFLYDLVKTTIMRLAFGMAEELRPHNVAAVAVTPGFLRSEAMLEGFGVTEANWREGAKQEPHFIASETPFFVGRAVAALAAEPQIMQRSGQTFSSWGLSDEYGFTDIDGERPHWGRYFAEHVLKQA